MAKKMRLIGWQVQPIIMVDDGEDLTSIPVQPQTIARSAWEAFKDGGDAAALEALRQQVETPEPGTRPDVAPTTFEQDQRYDPERFESPREQLDWLYENYPEQSDRKWDSLSAPHLAAPETDTCG